MKALSIRQPWAWAILAGIKRWENRSWTTDYRGPLVIHAGASRSEVAPSVLVRMPELTDVRSLTYGAIVGVVDLVDVLRFDNPKLDGERFAEGPYCWCLENPRALAEPIPFKGSLGLFNVPYRWDDAPAASGSGLVGVEPPIPTWTVGVLPLH